MGDREQVLDELAYAAGDFRTADAKLVQAALEALRAGVSAAEVARVAELPYRRVLMLRRYG